MHEDITNQDIIEASICKVLPPTETHATLPQTPATHMCNIIIIHRTDIGPALARRPLRAERAKRASFSRVRIGVQTMKTEPGAHVTREKVHEDITNQDIIEASICKVLPTAETHATLSQAPATHAYNIIIIHRTGIGPALPRRPLRSENSQTHKHV